jgi:subtilase family serine protease
MALVELGLTPRMFYTLRLYASASGIPAPSARQYSELPIGRAKLCADVFNVEEQLDVEAAYDMAPGAHQLVVGGDACDIGDFGLQGLFDANIAILNGAANHPLASAASNSWEGGDESQPADDTSIEHAFLVRAAAEGVGMYFSTGDFSGLFTPSSDPFATGVGGTTLGLGKAGDRLFETGWSTAQNLVNGKKWVIFGELGAAGGGASLLWNQPGYQAGVVPAALATVPGNRGGPVRSAPDISADADPFTGMAVGLLKSHRHKPATFGFIRVAGTSLAAPLVAGMVMAAQQGQPAAFGFLNPVLYRLPGTGALRDVLPLTARTNSLFRGVSCDARACGQQLLTTFDEQSPRMLGYFGQVALKGYDNMSGVGTPAGQRFISVLRRLALADGAVASLEEGSPSG